MTDLAKLASGAALSDAAASALAQFDQTKTAEIAAGAAELQKQIDAGTDPNASTSTNTSGSTDASGSTTNGGTTTDTSTAAKTQ